MRSNAAAVVLAEMAAVAGPDIIQYLVDRPEVVEAFLGCTDWAACSPDMVAVHKLFQDLHHAQQQVLARGGGRLVITFADDPDARTYTTHLAAA